MTGSRPIEAYKAAVCCVRFTSTPVVGFAQIPVIPRRLRQRVKSTLSGPSRSALRTGGKREKVVFGSRRRLRKAQRGDLVV
jgi:hypothetical protein